MSSVYAKDKPGAAGERMPLREKSRHHKCLRCRERRMIPMQQNKNEGVNAGQGVFRHSVTAYAAQMTAIC
ncbi:hypothetical protein KP13_03649 [Klebsiella pneumoniae subsp. pneumoniae Kp13]|nr:hypothetical protein KP13_03649 [Klebsiella pneumoniae subsp. pneumoniae Kp13]